MNKILLGGLLAVLTLFLIGCINPFGPQDVHWHADFKVMIDGNFVDFNKFEYMSTPYVHLSERTHLHDFNPSVIHVHQTGVTLAEFFDSIGMEFSDNCFDANSSRYCNSPTHQLQLYVNGKPNSQMGNYQPKDLDKILIFFDTTTPSQENLDSITNEACIYSLKCAPPPGFTIPPESCSADLPCTVP